MRKGTNAMGRGFGRRNAILIWAAALAIVWLALASRVYVNASWSDGAWGYLVLPLRGAPRSGDAVLFDPPEAAGSPIPYLKTVRGLPGDRVELDGDRRVSVNGAVLGIAKTHARDGRRLEMATAGDDPAGSLLCPRRTRGQPRQPLRGDRAGPAGAHPGPSLGSPRHSLARAGWAACEPRGGAAMTQRVVRRGCMLAAIVCVLTLVAQAGHAKDLGVRGTVWPVAEPDLLTEIEARLGEMETSGDLARMRREALDLAHGNGSRRPNVSRGSCPRVVSSH